MSKSRLSTRACLVINTNVSHFRLSAIFVGHSSFTILSTVALFIRLSQFFLLDFRIIFCVTGYVLEGETFNYFVTVHRPTHFTIETHNDLENNSIEPIAQAC